MPDLKFTSNQGEVIWSSEGSQDSTELHTFHDEATETGEGDVYTVGSKKTLTIEIFGTSSSRTVIFYGVGASGIKRNIKGVKLSDFSLGASTSGNNELWQFDITGLYTVIMEVSGVAGGNISVKGKAVA